MIHVTDAVVTINGEVIDIVPNSLSFEAEMARRRDEDIRASLWPAPPQFVNCRCVLEHRLMPEDAVRDMAATIFQYFSRGPTADTYVPEWATPLE